MVGTDLIAEIEKSSGLKEVALKLGEFRGFHGHESVTVEIFDYGPNAKHHYRYYCRAISESGKTASGNGGENISIALATTHWQDLDSLIDTIGKQGG